MGMSTSNITCTQATTSSFILEGTRWKQIIPKLFTVTFGGTERGYTSISTCTNQLNSPASNEHSQQSSFAQHSGIIVSPPLSPLYHLAFFSIARQSNFCSQAIRILRKPLERLPQKTSARQSAMLTVSQLIFVRKNTFNAEVMPKEEGGERKRFGGSLFVPSSSSVTLLRILQDPLCQIRFFFWREKKFRLTTIFPVSLPD